MREVLAATAAARAAARAAVTVMEAVEVKEGEMGEIDLEVTAEVMEAMVAARAAVAWEVATAVVRRRGRW